MTQVFESAAAARADDDKTYDAAWLRGVGFVENPPYGVRVRIPNDWIEDPTWLTCGDVANAHECPWDVENEHLEDGTVERALLISELPTRGHVRRLCAALGVSLKE